uniref:GGDEF domain-containing protein n=1 Tax=Bellilinea caldifistulae TaxID=360411 RepID=A0A7C4L2B4_9CHLR
MENRQHFHLKQIIPASPPLVLVTVVLIYFDKILPGCGIIGHYYFSQTPAGLMNHTPSNNLRFPDAVNTLTQKIEQGRRWLYLVAAFPGFLSVLLIWLQKHDEEVFIRFTYPFLSAALAIWCAALIWKRIPLNLIERSVLITTTLFFFAKYVYFLYFHPLLLEQWQEIEAVFWTFAFSFILSYIVFPRGLALRFNLLFLGMIIIAGAFRFSHLGSGLTLELIRLETRVAGILFLVFLLAKAKDDLNLSLAEANRIQEIAHTDTLTLLPNRRGMTALLEEHLTRKRHFSVILTDVDYFKRINDTFGHETGDQILREVGECLHLQLRASDVIGRWGGEEFLIIALEEDEKRALNLANRLRETVESYEFSNNLPITMSFGVTLSRERDTVKSLLQRADTAMYRAKNNGRNRVEWENPNSML